jgi:hypothetical protein
MRLYLLYPDNTVSDAGDYDEIPFAPPEGTAWVEGIPEGLEFYKEPPPLDKQLEEIFLGALVAYDGMIPPEQEADLWLLKDGITQMIRNNRLAAAQAKLQAVREELPDALKPVVDGMLEKFNG